MTTSQDAARLCNHLYSFLASANSLSSASLSEAMQRIMLEREQPSNKLYDGMLAEANLYLMDTIGRREGQEPHTNVVPFARKGDRRP